MKWHKMSCSNTFFYVFLCSICTRQSFCKILLSTFAVIENLPLFWDNLSKHKKYVTTSHFYNISCNQKSRFTIFCKNNLNRPSLLYTEPFWIILFIYVYTYLFSLEVTELTRKLEEKEKKLEEQDLEIRRLIEEKAKQDQVS